MVKQKRIIVKCGDESICLIILMRYIGGVEKSDFDILVLFFVPLIRP